MDTPSFPSASPEKSMGWGRLFASAVFSPSTATFEKILQDPKAKHPLPAVLWMLAGVVLGCLLPALAALLETGNPVQQPGVYLAALEPSLLMAGIIFLYVLALVGTIHLVARRMGGAGSFAQTVFVYTTFLAPLVFGMLLLKDIYGWPLIDAVLVVWILVAGYYAVQVVHRLTPKKAVWAGGVFPILLAFVLFVIFALILFSATLHTYSRFLYDLYPT